MKIQVPVFAKQDSKGGLAMLAWMDFMALIANPADVKPEEVKTLIVTKLQVPVFAKQDSKVGIAIFAKMDIMAMYVILATAILMVNQIVNVTLLVSVVA